MSRNPRKPEGPIIYHSQQDLEEPRHDKIEPFESVSEVLEWEEVLRNECFGKTNNRLQEIWFRGTRKHFRLTPGIYRPKITDIASKWEINWRPDEDTPRDAASELELKRLALERDMLVTFARESRSLLQYDSEQELYFVARHYGMPSRLLDWSISPLIALFMCVFPEPLRKPPGMDSPQEKEEDGVIYAMNPAKLKPPGYICDQYDPKVSEAIEFITKWKAAPKKPHILAIRPHTLAGRIERQMSRFTLHGHGSKRQRNRTLQSRRVSNEHKPLIRAQLERIGVNQFTVYNTLDRLVNDIDDRFS
jgi:hypothetical protein